MNTLEVALAVQELRVRRALWAHTFRPFTSRQVVAEPVHQGARRSNNWICPCRDCREVRNQRVRDRRRGITVMRPRGPYKRKVA
jgi:hypothetical protein